ncbi:MAG: hypothetical protein MJ172_06055 [Clostridia bacterium]|nr:hypothetical protein [Clostridia bacterium]
MKKFTRFLSCFVAGSILLMTGCTSKTAVDTTDASATQDTTVSVAETSAIETSAVQATTVETTEFDINDYTFENVYGSQLINYLNHQYYFDGEPIPIVESNYYFVNTFLELTNYGNYYGAYPVTSEGFFDLAAEIPTSADGAEPMFTTYGDFYRQYSETILYSTMIVLRNAQEVNLELDEDTVNSIDELLVNLEENAAKPNDMELDEYLALYYGPDCNRESFKQVLYNYYLNDVFTNYYIENYQYSDEETIMSPTVRYALYYAPMGSSEEILTSAEESANAMFANCAGDIDVFAELGAAEYANGGNTEYGELTLTKGQTVPNFDAWSFDEARQPGDMDVIYTEEYGYFVVAFVSLDMNLQAMEEIAVENLGMQINANIENNAYNFYTNDEFLPPVVVESNEIITGSAPEETEVAVNPADVEASQAIAAEESVETTYQTTEVPDNGNGMMTVLIGLASVGVVALLGILALLIVKVRGDKDTKKSKDVSEKIEE